MNVLDLLKVKPPVKKYEKRYVVIEREGEREKEGEKERDKEKAHKSTLPMKRCPKGSRRNKKTGKCEDDKGQVVEEPQVKENEKGEKKKVAFITMAEDADKFNYEELMKRLTKNKLNIVIPKPEDMKPIPEPEKEPPAKKKPIRRKPTKIVLEEEKEEEEKEEPKKEKKREKRGKKEEIIIPSDEIVMENRLPEKFPNVIIKASNYYMNDREIFVNFINSLFSSYKKELEANKSSISCDSIGNTSSDFSLLTHQKIVRDYINLFTPYRGLLLFHGLGSGKSCTSIAIAEGMKDAKRVIIMTPASLRKNYMEELKKCGDLLYKKNQFWERIEVRKKGDEERIRILSKVLNLSEEYVKKRGGAWLVNVQKEANYASLNASEKAELDEQLDEMIRKKYIFINYNGLRKDSLKKYTNNYTENMFDDSVVIIDEAHNLISRIVNKLNNAKGKEKKEQDIQNEKGERPMPSQLATKLYEYLLGAKDARIVLLSGTPIINYANEFAILFNILRGYIKTWEINLNVQTTKKVNKETLQEMLSSRENRIDYIDYSSGKLTITRNPYGFRNTIPYEGVSKDQTDTPLNDEDFQDNVIRILKTNGIDIQPKGIVIRNQKALPDNKTTFEEMFLNENGSLKNTDILKRRILGLSSYFKSAQEGLLPDYNKLTDYHLVKIPMSNFQFQIYEAMRKKERELDKGIAKKKGKGEAEGAKKTAEKEISPSYRIFSRMFCNYAMEDRPFPRSSQELQEIVEKADKIDADVDIDDEHLAELETDEILEKDVAYKERIQETLKKIKEKPEEYLSKEALKVHSPKFLDILENIQDPDHVGLHLIYSQFRTMEGIGIFSLVLENNGFARFRIKDNGVGGWEIAMKEEDLGKPTYALYTGTESTEEKEILRNIYNGSWDLIPTNIASYLRGVSNNNNLGEIIKVFMITSSGSEGINLRNTRYVHIMEPYWHPVRAEQVIGRARRICSHKDLPKELQNVEVFVYIMVFTEEQLKSDYSIELRLNDKSKLDPKNIVTTDETLYEISQIKEKFVSQLTDIVKQTAFDCGIYGGQKCVSFGDVSSARFSYVPDYKKEQKDIVSRQNEQREVVQVKKITIQGVEFCYKDTEDSQIKNIYDLDSCYESQQNEGVNPILVGKLTLSKEGNLFKRI
jgi:Type III restriction enzyme, res subunit/Helicase conserved C-terminal domain